MPRIAGLDATTVTSPSDARLQRLGAEFRIRIVSLLLVLFFATRVRPMQPALLPAPRVVLWIGAHPDDESLAAPLLEFWCNERFARCTMLIATRGEAGLCHLPGGCLPDLATVRSNEALAAASYFHASLIQLTHPDGGPWPPITSELASWIEQVHPDLILTFDPRHGTTCHPDHRAIAAATLDAIPQLSYRPEVWLLETRFAPFTFSSATPSTSRFDAQSRWFAVLDDMRLHPSQFDETWLAGIENVPASDRAVYVASAEQVMQREVSRCSP